MGEWKLRILHISDLHERGPREGESFRRRRVLGSEWERNLEELLKDGPIDLVCFTGDVADWGKPEEYGPATDFIEAEVGALLGDGGPRGAGGWRGARGGRTGTRGPLSRGPYLSRQTFL